MTSFETVISHINQGVTYSWDLTVLVGLGITVPAALREVLLRSRTTKADADLVNSIYKKHFPNQRIPISATDPPDDLWVNTD